jgi:glycosyltransferase involved in cell wall biosynthesis
LRILIVSDPPVLEKEKNVHGVQVLLSHLVDELDKKGVVALIFSSKSLFMKDKSKSDYEYISDYIRSNNIDSIHIATQGFVGLLALRYCIVNNMRFTTAYHTYYPDLLRHRYNFPISIANIYIRWFLKKASSVFVLSQSVAMKLHDIGIYHTKLLRPGVDTSRFHPQETREELHAGLRRPFFLYVGRIAHEKGVFHLCSLHEKLPGTIIMVGDGPLHKQLMKKFPAICFVGEKYGDELVRYYQLADVFIFPSDTDPFGLVLLEALSCGLPVAAKPVNGPKHIITDPRVGVLDHDLVTAAQQALKLSRSDCRHFALDWRWDGFAEAFLDASVPVGPVVRHGRRRIWPERNDPFMHVLQAIITQFEKLLFANERQNG